MLIVDGITSVGVFEQKMDEWGVDAFVTGSQKALMLPPGLGLVALSERALDAAKQNRTPRFYFDLLKELKAQRDEHTTAWTAATFNHNNTGFPLTGAHSTVQCAQCHVNGNYNLTSAACVTCHLKDFQGTTQPNHVQANFSQTCTQT